MFGGIKVNVLKASFQTNRTCCTPIVPFLSDQLNVQGQGYFFKKKKQPKHSTAKTVHFFSCFTLFRDYCFHQLRNIYTFLVWMKCNMKIIAGAVIKTLVSCSVAILFLFLKLFSFQWLAVAVYCFFDESFFVFEFTSEEYISLQLPTNTFIVK